MGVLLLLQFMDMVTMKRHDGSETETVYLCLEKKEGRKEESFFVCASFPLIDILCELSVELEERKNGPK